MLADLLRLSYSSSAGIITILSIQDTKRETVRVLARRLMAFGAALALGAVCFGFLGYGVPGFVLFLFFFSAICIRFRMQDGISVNAVLMTHFLANGNMSMASVENELALLLIGSGIGLLLNLYIPDKKREIRRIQREIEGKFKEILGAMAELVMDEDISHKLDQLEILLKEGERNAFQDMENRLLTDTRYYLRYMNLRKSQAGLLRRMDQGIRRMDQGIRHTDQRTGRMEALPAQAAAVSDLFRQTADSFHEYNNAAALLAALRKCKASMEGQPLPVSREEFESRALLYWLLLELEDFLEAKARFVQELAPEEITAFWKEEEGHSELYTREPF